MPPLSFPPVDGRPIHFVEAIAAAEARNVVLPDAYYGELQGVARQLAYSIAGVASHDQLKAVMDSLTDVLKTGQTFKQWQREQAVKDLKLPAHRLDNIFRTNIQGQYMAGRWEQFERNKQYRPYLMYDAINDARVRDAHLAMDGIIRPVDDPYWATHSPLNGYRCRCGLIALSEAQAQARSGIGKGLNKPVDETAMQPDPGWDYSPRDRFAGIEQAITKRQDQGETYLTRALKETLQTGNAITPASEFASWANQVAATGYKARHEFMPVASLPDFVMEDSAVVALNPINNQVYISDHQLKHALRPVKNNRGAALPMAIIEQLPTHLTTARWFYDSRHHNLMAVFDAAAGDSVGKAAIAINFKKGKRTMNAITTSGMISESNTKMDIYREIIRKSISDEPVTVQAADLSPGFKIPGQSKTK